MSTRKGSKKCQIQKCTNCVRSFLLTFFHGLLYRLFPVLQQPSECDCLLSVVKVMARRESSALKPQGQSLSVEDADFLKKNTKYSEEDIKLWFKNFKKDCPNGILDKKKVCEIYEQKISPNKDSKFIVDQLFRIIDDDNNGGIDFKVADMNKTRSIFVHLSSAGVYARCEHGGEWNTGGEAPLDVQVLFSIQYWYSLEHILGFMTRIILAP